MNGYGRCYVTRKNLKQQMLDEIYNNTPLPEREPKTTEWIYGGVMHFLNLLILNKQGQVLLRVDSDFGYRGDSRILYRSGNRYAWLWFGYWPTKTKTLIPCNTYQEAQAIMNDLEARVKWFSSAEDTLWFFREYDWEEHYGINPKQVEFVRNSMDCLEKIIADNEGLTDVFNWLSSKTNPFLTF